MADCTEEVLALTARQWEEPVTMNVLRTHVYNDRGREGEEWSCCTGPLHTVSFPMKSPNARDVCFAKFS